MSQIKLYSFISSERDRFETRHNNMFSNAFSQAARYYDFLKIVRGRYEETSRVFTSSFEEMQADFKKNPDQQSLSERQMSLIKEHRELSGKLHLEIESFYLFSKILLDKLARAIEFYFGPERNLSLDSHDGLYKCIESYSSQKGLDIDEGLIALMKTLKKEISDFRDYQISHHKSPRTIRGTLFSPEGKTKLLLTNLYPKEGDEQIESKAINDLMESLDEYIIQIINFIEANREKTNLELKS